MGSAWNSSGLTTLTAARAVLSRSPQADRPRARDYTPIIPDCYGSLRKRDTVIGERIYVVLNWFEELKQRVPTGG